MYKLFLTLRYLLHRRIVIVPILAVMLCVAMDLIVTSLMGGFLDKIRTSVRGLFGDVIIGNESLAGFGYYDTYQGLDGKDHPGLLQYIRKAPQVKAATAIIETVAVLRLPEPARKGFTRPVGVYGIQPGEYAQVTDFQDGLYWEHRFAPGVVDRAEATSAEEPPDAVWTGPPSFDKVPIPATQPVPLAELHPEISVDALSGIIVGVRVFWPPEKDGRYRRQELRPGQEPVQLTFLPMTPGGGKVEPVTNQYLLVDTSYSHIPQIDQQVAYVPLKQLQELLLMNASTGSSGFPSPARATRVLVKLKDGVELKAGHDAVQAAADAWIEDRTRQFAEQPASLQAKSIVFEPFREIGPFRELADRPEAGIQVKSNMKVLIWEEANKEYFAAIANQRFIALLMVGVVSLTVVALIWVIFIMIVVEKTKDIGIIKSVGGSAGGVAAIFIVWSAVIGAIGSVLGGVLGWLFIRFINPIERWLSAVLLPPGERLFDPKAYLFDTIPARFEWHEMFWIAGLAVVAAMLGASLPAWRAGRMDPVESLRYE